MRLARLAGLACLFLLAGVPAKAADYPAVLSEKLPRHLSEFGFFAGAGIARPAPGIVEYDLVTPLFSDFAVKTRHVHVPEGMPARYVATEAFAFPAGSALIKTFAFPADFRRPDEKVRLIETRVLLRQADGWVAAAYVWNEDESDAVLKIAGKRLDLSFVDDQGMEVSFSYAVPNRNQCKGCHAIDGELVPIGPKARHLNRDFDHGPMQGGGPANQLAWWAENGLIEGLPETGVERAADWLDDSAPLEARARTWLDVNCAHCHRREGPASNSGLFLTFGEREPTALGIGKRPVAAGRGAGDNAFDIEPGHPERSILLARVASTEPGVMMPELGRALADDRAVDLLRDWILSLR
ncbi:MAG: SO2930 family diheme c-type cytochrome [Pseudomonadota bacterium]|nr:SO2930 family diheme c-type cytochrome [Pseudomonadota bacterium]